MITSIVVVGGGLAAVSACAALREGGYAGRLSLVGAEPHPPYDRPPLSKDFLLGKVDGEALPLKPESWYAEADVDLRLGVAARAIRPAAGVVELADGSEVAADRVLLATGGVPRRLPVPGGDHPCVHTLRDRGDAERLRAALVPGARVVVVGGGLIGAEVAATAVALGCQVRLVDPLPAPLAAAVGPEVAEVLHARHAAYGVRVHTGVVERIVGGSRGGDPPVVQISGPADMVPADTVPADVVVVGVGIAPATELAASAGLAVDHGVLVDATGRTSHPQVFAAGDAARRVGPDGPLPRTEHWDAARRGGEAAAAGMLGQPPPADAPAWFWSDRYDVHLEVVGEMGLADATVVRGALDTDGVAGGVTGGFTVFGLRAGRCVAAVTVNRPREARAAQRLIGRGVPVEARRLADEDTDLRTLLRPSRGER